MVQTFAGQMNKTMVRLWYRLSQGKRKTMVRLWSDYGTDFRKTFVRRS